MKDRIKKIRRELDLTQQEFANKIGISRGNIGAYEVGKNAPSDAVISLICTKFNVRESWLRNGTGEIFVTQSLDEQITTFIGEIQNTENDTFKKRFVSMLAGLEEADWKVLEKIALGLVKKKS